MAIIAMQRFKFSMQSNVLIFSLGFSLWGVLFERRQVMNKLSIDWELSILPVQRKLEAENKMIEKGIGENTNIVHEVN